MRKNGSLFVQFIVEDGGRNEWGEPAASATEWVGPIPCHIATNTDNELAHYEDGTSRQVSYTILTEPLPYSGLRRVKLERRGNDLGEFAVISAEPIDTQSRLKIIV